MKSTSPMKDRPLKVDPKKAIPTVAPKMSEKSTTEIFTASSALPISLSEKKNPLSLIGQLSNSDGSVLELMIACSEENEENRTILIHNNAISALLPLIHTTDLFQRSRIFFLFVSLLKNKADAFDLLKAPELIPLAYEIISQVQGEDSEIALETPWEGDQNTVQSITSVLSFLAILSEERIFSLSLGQSGALKPLVKCASLQYPELRLQSVITLTKMLSFAENMTIGRKAGLLQPVLKLCTSALVGDQKFSLALIDMFTNCSKHFEFRSELFKQRGYSFIQQLLFTRKTTDARTSILLLITALSVDAEWAQEMVSGDELVRYLIPMALQLATTPLSDFSESTANMKFGQSAASLSKSLCKLKSVRPDFLLSALTSDPLLEQTIPSFDKSGGVSLANLSPQGLSQVANTGNQSIGKQNKNTGKLSQVSASTVQQGPTGPKREASMARVSREGISSSSKYLRPSLPQPPDDSNPIFPPTSNIQLTCALNGLCKLFCTLSAPHEAREAAADAIAVICDEWEEGQIHVYPLEGVLETAILTLSKVEHGSPGLVRATINLVASLSQHLECRRLFVEWGCGQLCLNYIGSAQIPAKRAASASALSYLLLDPTLRATLLYTSSPLLIQGLAEVASRSFSLDWFGDGGIAKRAALRALGILGSDPTGREAIASEGAIPVMVGVLQDSISSAHGINAAVALSSLYSCCCEGGKCAILACEEGALELAHSLTFESGAAAGLLRLPKMAELLEAKLKQASASARYFLTGRIEPNELLPDGFYDMESCTSGFKSISSLESQPLSAYFSVILADSTTDQNLKDMVEESQKITQEVEAAHDGCNFYEMESAKISAISHYVSIKLGGEQSEDRYGLFGCDFQLSEAKKMSRSNVVPIGLLKHGICLHRSILFKFLADRCGLHVSLERVGTAEESEELREPQPIPQASLQAKVSEQERSSGIFNISSDSRPTSSSEATNKKDDQTQKEQSQLQKDSTTRPNSQNTKKLDRLQQQIVQQQMQQQTKKMTKHKKNNLNFKKIPQQGQIHKTQKSWTVCNSKLFNNKCNNNKCSFNNSFNNSKLRLKLSSIKDSHNK
eukprot:TRINITY_DN1228_c0_g1_i1.p1 TRINITY_DN1228_c0_g1~~TRINITY_DN1228_c0_g1_i1.p1  ORF type:complete len:1078 (-),score=371.04 TRINITY_DN1228_c0_g1_i1:328-3561(-)